MAYKSLTDPAKGLNPSERRVALLAQAGLSSEGIARVMESTATSIQDVLKRPHVQRHMMAIEATFVDDIRSTAEKVNKAIINQTERAVHVTTTIMEDMFANRGDVQCAKLAHATAKDILDRAGATAPKKVDVYTESHHSIDTDSLADILNVLKEMNQ